MATQDPTLRHSPRYGPGARALLEVQPDHPVHTGKVEAFGAIKAGIDKVQDFIRPAVVKEQQAIGEQEALAAFNKGSFEPAKPFSVRSEAFNTTGEKLVANKASMMLDEGMRQAMKTANGNVKVLDAEMQKVRDKVLSEVHPQLVGLQTDLVATYDRGLAAARRQTVALAERRAIAAQRKAVIDAADVLEGELETLALTGTASADEMAAALAQGQERLAKFGPRGEFTVNGVTYPADPSRSGLLSESQLQGRMDDLSKSANALQLESSFLASEAPGEFAREFEARVRSGNSPFDAATSLKMMRDFNSRARTEESRIAADAKAAEAVLDTAISDTFEGFVTMSDAGIPVAIPEADREELRAKLAGNPEKLAEADRKFAAADAIVETHGMTSAQVLEYRDQLVAEAQAAADRGELDLDAAAQLKAIGDKIKAAEKAITTETVGATAARDLLANGGILTADDIAAMRDRAGGKPDVLEAISELEKAVEIINRTEGMSGGERQELLDNLGQQLRTVAVKGAASGSEVGIALEGLEIAAKRSEKIAGLASKDPVRFAAAKGIPLPSLEGAENMAAVGQVVADRFRTLQPAARAEGVQNAVPLSDEEVTAISEVFRNSTRAERVSFLANISTLGREEAQAVYARLGMEEPALFAAGVAHSNDNAPAAAIILRGIEAPKLGGGTPTDQASARAEVFGDALGMFTAESMKSMDAAALAYARGVAVADGGRDVTLEDMVEGYQIATGRDKDGLGGLVDTEFGKAILPPGTDGRVLSRAIDGMTDETLRTLTNGAPVVDRLGREFTAAELSATIEGLRPHPTKPGVLIPVDEDGAAFGVTRIEGEVVVPELLEFDIEMLTSSAPAAGFWGRLFGG